jgi:hypothetical protein
MKSSREIEQVSVRKMNENEPSMTRRNDTDIVKTRVAIHLWEKFAGSLMIGRTTIGVQRA